MSDAKHLDESLSSLRAEIQALGLGDQEARQRLETLIQDIERTLGNPEDAPADETLGDRLKTSILVFEASHPRLATVMNEVMEKLSHMGI